MDRFRTEVYPPAALQKKPWWDEGVVFISENLEFFNCEREAEASILPHPAYVIDCVAQLRCVDT